MFDLLIKRIYEKADLKDGYRILIDRLWPRGISKNKAGLDDWAKQVAPSTEIRKAFHHDLANVVYFRKRYIAELEQNTAAHEFAALVAERLKENNVTLLYGAKNQQSNNAIVLKDWIEKKPNK